LKDLLSCFFYAGITLAIECLFWCFFPPYRRIRFLLWCAVVNLFSNITLNVFLGFHSYAVNSLLSPLVLAGEVVVVIVEFALLYMLERSQAKRLFLLTFLANLITYSCSFLFLLFDAA